ncbi:WRKY DNA-binding transcription factor 70-like [Rhododendron vialii]|uniref:WRKY DNA-binding transcription factor 70-like n=1 Tax=Rhododendron vialii TaxID=182163 RepID=UPI00265E9022|nr:WRKY DNA-binding transcription factor 70-like [Rhododendron vialii]
MHMDSSPPANLSGDREKIIQELIQGRESANKLLTLILGKPPYGDDKSSSVSADDLLMKIFASFAESISVLNRGAPLEQVFDKIPVNTVGSLPIGLQPEDSEGSSKSTSVLKQRRGCYKRRKTNQTWTKITPNLIDDGHAWRKYGQKVILNTKHPRNYYRCTHKFDQGCQATKQVQSTEEDPPMFRTTYNGSHTCQNLLKPPQIILDSTIPGDSSNSVFLSFGSTNYPGTNLNHETYYPTFPLVKQEYSPNQELKPSFDHNKSTLANPLLTFDSSEPMLTLSSGSDHGDMISSSGAYSCTASTHDDSHHSFDLDVFGAVGDIDVSEFGFC